MNEVTITLPAIDENLIATLSTEQINLQSNETLAIQSLREKYTPLARHAGFIRTGYESQSTSNTSWERKAYYYGGKSTRVHGLLCLDDFDSSNNAGRSKPWCLQRNTTVAYGRCLRKMLLA